MGMMLRRYHEKAPSGPVADEAELPGGNASKADWEAHALAQGRTAEELDGLTRDQIRDLFN